MTPLSKDEIKSTALLPVFDQKLKNLIKRIKAELGKKKQKEPVNRKQLRAVINEARKLKRYVKAMQEKEGLFQETVTVTCPHCSGEFSCTARTQAPNNDSN